MPLTSAEELILFEIYDVPKVSAVVVSGEWGLSQASFDINANPVRSQLETAIAFINADEAIAARVSDLIGDYEAQKLSTDNSDIEGGCSDGCGYKFNPERNRKLFQRTLFTYTGIQVARSNSNRMRVMG